MEQEFFLDIPGTKKGIYLNQHQIDLLLIVSCETKEQFENYFYKVCGQFPNQKLEDIIPNYESLDVEEAKRILFEKYKETLTDYKTNHRMTLQNQAIDKLKKMRLSNGDAIPQEILDKVTDGFQNLKGQMIKILHESDIPANYIVNCMESIEKLPIDCSPIDIVKVVTAISKDLSISDPDRLKFKRVQKQMMDLIQRYIEMILEKIAEYDQRVLQQEGNENGFSNFIQKFNRLMKDDSENVKSVTYEDMVALHAEIMNNDQIDTIIIATGKYENSVYSSGDSAYFDPYLSAKALQYCKMSGKHMRYHALFDYAHLTKLVNEGKGPEDKEEILAEMRQYIQATFEFINKYNASVRGTDQPTINVVEIFNELVEYNKKDDGPYEMAWEKHFGITIKDIVQCFDGIEKPEGVEFMYNETMLEESPERVAKVEEVFNEIMHLRPDLIDVFGNQMHLQHTHADPDNKDEKKGPAAVEQGLDLMRRIQDRSYANPGGLPKHVRTEITEFDLHISKETYFDKIVASGENDATKKGLTPEQIATYKQKFIGYISDLIKSKGLDIDRVTYWTLIDTVDHNLVRACKELLDANPDKSIKEIRMPETLYAGAYGRGATSIQKEHSEDASLSSDVVYAGESEYVETHIEESGTVLDIVDQPEVETPMESFEQVTPRKEEEKKLVRKPKFNKGFISEYIILAVILTILLSLVLLTVLSIT